MPYILLVCGVLIGLYALYNFLRRARKDQAQKMLLSLAVALLVLFALVLVIGGRLPLAAILAAICVPLMFQLYRLFQKGKSE